MNRLLTTLCMLFVLSWTMPSAAQDRDEEMLNASLRFIKEKANLNKKEYQKFAKIYIEYNEQLAKLNRELRPDSKNYIERWSKINDEYSGSLEKELADSTRTKVRKAQWELGQKIFNQWSDRNRREMDAQTQMWLRSAQMNRQFMLMQPQVMDARRRQMQNLDSISHQQTLWWQNYWKDQKQMPDTIGERKNLPFTPFLPSNAPARLYPRTTAPWGVHQRRFGTQPIPNWPRH